MTEAMEGVHLQLNAAQDECGCLKAKLTEANKETKKVRDQLQHQTQRMERMQKVCGAVSLPSLAADQREGGQRTLLLRRLWPAVWIALLGHEGCGGAHGQQYMLYYIYIYYYTPLPLNLANNKQQATSNKQQATSNKQQQHVSVPFWPLLCPNASDLLPM